MNLKQLIISIIFITVITDGSSMVWGMDDGSENIGLGCYQIVNYQPCKCEREDMVCKDLLIENITHLFGQLGTKRIRTVKLLVAEDFPADVTGTVEITHLKLECNSVKNYERLVVNRAAFSGTKSVTKMLDIHQCDFNEFNWEFLIGFDKLAQLTFRNIKHFPQAFSSFPTALLPSLIGLHLISPRDFFKFADDTYVYPSTPTKGLTSLTIDNIFNTTNDDDSIQTFLARWITPKSQNSLTHLWLKENKLTKIPSELAKYTNLKRVVISGNNVDMAIQQNAFNFTNGEMLKIYISKVTSIAPGAFQGLFKELDLSTNNLTTFSKDVFEPLLKKGVTITASENPFNCTHCAFSWLEENNYYDLVTIVCNYQFILMGKKFQWFIKTNCTN